MALTDRIEINPKIMLGKPVIRGARIPVELIVRKIGEGASERDLLDAYPGLTPEDIREALVYAADVHAAREEKWITSTKGRCTRRRNGKEKTRGRRNGRTSRIARKPGAGQAHVTTGSSRWEL